MTKFEQDLLRFLSDLEGGVANLAGDRGGWTYRGISTRYYPEIKAMYDSKDPSIDEYVDLIYLNDYLRSIYGYEQLVVSHPWFVKLLFPAKVHGSGDEDIVKFVQRRANESSFEMKVDGILGPKTLAYLDSLTSEEEDSLRHALSENLDKFVELRVSSVGGYENGIRNRVVKNFRNALGAPLQVVSPAVPSNDSVLTAKLSIISSPANEPEVFMEGWEQLPIGLDLSIEIRSADHASNTIPTAEYLQA